ncbi:MAG: SIMPL domain-containing protein [Halobacteriales archaeon]|nr:SIMPL domain-containing protein [Halobacteriales archaeon]
MTRTTFGIVGLALLLITAGCLGAAPAATGTGAADAGDGNSPSVSVSASGSVSMEPDLAVVRVAAEARADTADAAREQVAADVAAVREALAELGLEGDAVTTASFTLQPEYDYSGESRELVGYRAVHALTVEAGVDGAGAVIDAAVAAGAVRVQGVQFTLTDESRQSAREQALAAAMGNAAADAGAIADAGGLSIDGVRSVSTGAPVVSPFAGRVAMAEDAAGSTTIESGPVTVSAHVSVVYAVE